jgi:hypothetical protein
LYIAIATGVSAPGVCQQGLKSWLITDCIVFAWMIPDYFAQEYKFNLIGL